MGTIFFNAFHAPIGAHASFTLGCLGPKGGLGLELGGPAYEDVYIGVERRDGPGFLALPFFTPANDDEAKRFDHSGMGPRFRRLDAFPASRVERDFKTGTDTWRAEDLEFRILSPVTPVPDPDASDDEALRFTLCPAVVCELTFDNRAGAKPRTCFFGYKGSERHDAMREFDHVEPSRFTAVGQGRNVAIASRDEGIRSAQGFRIELLLSLDHPENHAFGLGAVAALMATVPAGERKTFRFAVCFHRAGLVTSGIDASYFYTRYFKTIEDVADYALANVERYAAAARASDAAWAPAHLTDDQRFQLAHAVRSYYGSTQFLDWKGKPFWVVNEGEYRMMNTFDLTVDQLFFELRLNSWTVKNELEMFATRYKYEDRLHAPGGPDEHEGGISFTHDMGMGNRVTRPGYSTYEQAGLTGCFSYMTHEQLVNWVLCGACYAHHAQDAAWVKKRLGIFSACLRSMVNRDHSDPFQRRGVMQLDSSRTKGGAEITTYDSLDVSLGQSRSNLYLAVKSWASYLALERILAAHGKAKEAALAGEQAQKCAATIAGFATPEGWIPAVMGEGNQSRIIPAIEGLVFPWFLGMADCLTEDGRFGALIRALKTHLKTVLARGCCLYDDGGWKLSSTADNSWLSKIYLCQFVARRVLGWPQDAMMKKADAAHVAWLLKDENLVYAWSDQMVSGIARGSKYYPRGVTSALWLLEG